MNAPAHSFRTITDADWEAMFRARRALGHIDGNSMLARIRARVAANTPRQSTAQSERRPLITTACRSDAFSFTAAGSADRKGGGTPRAEAGGGEHFPGATPDTKANDREEAGAKIRPLSCAVSSTTAG